MKRSILFIINNLNCGGAEKSLISLLQSFDYSKYKVDLLLLTNEGLFINKIPEQVNILNSPEEFTYFNMSLKKALLKSIKRFRFDIFFSRLMLVFIFKTEKNKNVREQKLWRFISFCLSNIENTYDVSVGYLQKTPTYFCVEKVIAKKKIGYFLNDYNQLKMDKKIDVFYFSKLDRIVADSDVCKNILISNFPEFKEKFIVQKNIVSQDIIRTLAKDNIKDYHSGFKLISVGRLSNQKGYDLAIRACKILVDKGLDFRWYILGEGEEVKYLLDLIKKLKLQDYFVFLGIRENHYPYIKNADIFVHTARYEGYGIVVAEAKILRKPMVLTNFNVAKSHIQHNYNGLIAEMNSISIAENLERLILDKNLRKLFSENLAKENFGTEKEIEKFYKLIEN